jgi:hypothetical protein
MLLFMRDILMRSMLMSEVLTLLVLMLDPAIAAYRIKARFYPKY